ncbi:hypothetical protein SNOG_03391 [Parastagonospora nodorum SN15]|uniref:Uncharacterized protein n=1 Tax=Phaeosphaeria nodorum (strain SN15 / ATCC MYA-4574 / FGSC 10173) TaxID=321614 RepID=Q0UXX3_PHANO|nr:hypothetical protein SNOG_03391 [Parastagonospora nodorum SN15]EAT88596.1 hypothetical protein SNOG_03391 [Parastagonospora nodorum SN15]
MPLVCRAIPKISQRDPRDTLDYVAEVPEEEATAPTNFRLWLWFCEEPE